MLIQGKTFLIGEAGVNHNGDYKLAIKLIDIAVEAGLDAVKFQTWKTENLLTKNVKKADYQISTTGAEETQFEMIKKLELPFEDFKKLKSYAESNGILFLSTAADTESLEYLIDIGLNIFKLSSADLTNYPYLKFLAKYNKQVILSTGMANIQEIKDALAVLLNNGTDKKNISILHCNTEYPTAMEDVNLHAMEHIRAETGIENIGYSDHTMGIEIPIAAVALGAKVIEKHFTIDRNMEGPDHKASLEPVELQQMVKTIRNVEIALTGSKMKTPTASEMKNIPIARKSIVAIENIKEGDVFTSNNLGVKRPGTGISPMDWENVIGQMAWRDFNIDELIVTKTKENE